MLSPKSVAKPKANATTSFEAIGTHWDIEIYDDISPASAERLWRGIHARIEVFDQTYSRFRADSVVTQMSQQAGQYELPADAQPMLELYQKLYELTEGLMTPLIGQTLADAGYDANYSLRAKRLQSPPAWEDVMSYDNSTLTLKQPALLDFGAAGKGYLVDIIGEVINEWGIAHYTVDASGDILHHGPDPLRVGLENPQDLSQVIGVATINNQALCGSATNRRRWGSYHHIINPTELQSPEHLASVWTVAKTTMLADGLATALFFTSAQKLHKQYNFDYACLYSDGRLQHSPDFPGEFFS